MEFSGQTAVITGGASGICRMVVFRLARAGAHVVIGDVDQAGSAAVVAEAKAEGLSVEAVALDLTSGASIEVFGVAVRDRTPPVRVLVNGAGWDSVVPFRDTTPDFRERVMAINLTGPIHLTQALLPVLTATPHGRIVNIASDAGRVGSAGETVYSAAKGGLIAFTKSLAREVARFETSVNCVCPGPIDTPLFRRQPEGFRAKIIAAVPQRRAGKPEEIAEMVWFFARPQSTYITGQAISVNGGLTMVG